MWLVALAILAGTALIAWAVFEGAHKIARQVLLIARIRAGDEVAKRQAIGDGHL